MRSFIIVDTFFLANNHLWHPTAYQIEDNKIYGPFWGQTSVYTDDGQLSKPKNTVWLPESEKDWVIPEDIDDLNDVINGLLKSRPNNERYEYRALPLAIGKYYPRIWRGDPAFAPFPNQKEIFYETYCNALNQYQLLLNELAEIFKVVEPRVANNDVFGSRIRNLLIIASTEVEAQWTGILKANNHGESRRLNTKDYVKLLQPLKLNEYAVELKWYTDSSLFSPFTSWDVENSTQSLAWYHAYNKVKHNREDSFQEAKLVYALNAVAAVFVLLCAQFGYYHLKQDLHNNLFLPRVDLLPTWDLEECYYGFVPENYKASRIHQAFGDRRMSPANYNFS